MKKSKMYKNKYMEFRIFLVEEMLKDEIPVKVMASVFNMNEQNIYNDLRALSTKKDKERRNNGGF
tara:strand:+ start:673 stop:867 length:195 start_codon:yes stop_codon:yes gene_type:complete